MAPLRFRARRGNPVRILSDNGANFVGAERKLHDSIAEIEQERVNA